MKLECPLPCTLELHAALCFGRDEFVRTLIAICSKFIVIGPSSSNLRLYLPGGLFYLDTETELLHEFVIVLILNACLDFLLLLDLIILITSGTASVV